MDSVLNILIIVNFMMIVMIVAFNVKIILPIYHILKIVLLVINVLWILGNNFISKSILLNKHINRIPFDKTA